MVDKKIADNESSIPISVSQETNQKLIQKYHFHYRKITGGVGLYKKGKEEPYFVIMNLKLWTDI